LLIENEENRLMPQIGKLIYSSDELLIDEEVVLGVRGYCWQYLEHDCSVPCVED